MALARPCGGLDRKSSPKVPRQHLGASRRSIGPLTREVEFERLGCIDLHREAIGGCACKKVYPLVAADRDPP
jgi:hypothetical protein